MNTLELCFGQRIDPKLGILEPWYTNPCMDRIKQLPLHNQIDVVLEWGGGASTLWWAKTVKNVYSVDHSATWTFDVCNMFSQHNISNAQITYVPTHEGDQSEKRDEYIYQYKDIRPTICIVDGVHRYECAEAAVKYYKPTVLIIDNHQQDYVFMCPKLDELLEGVKMERFIQPDHKDHEGNPWATAIFYL